MRPITVLIVDDDPEVRKVLRTGLEQEGWTVDEAWDRDSLFERLESSEVDLVTLDLTLGEQDGLELARDLRVRRNVPILMITGRADPFDRVRGLEMGADDYIVKPFLIREVVLRIRHTLERYEHPVQRADVHEAVAFDHSQYDLEHRVLWGRDGEQVNLTGLERQLLEFFLRHPGRVLSRDDISQALHGREWSPYDRTIDGHVARLRRKIEPTSDSPVLIRSVRGVGYVFNGAVRSSQRTV